MNGSTARNAIGLDLGGTNIHIGIMESGKIIHQEDIGFEHHPDVQHEVQAIKNAIQKYLDKYPKWPLGIACAGFFDYRKNQIVRGINFRGVAHPEFLPSLQLLFNRGKIAFLNDADAAALASAWITQKNVFHLTMGTGIGTGIAEPSGRILMTMDKIGLDLGHCEISSLKSPVRCGCGSDSCMESFLGKLGLQKVSNGRFPKLKEMREAPDELFDFPEFREHRLILARFCRLVQIGFGPEVISFSGGNSRFVSDNLIEEISEKFVEGFNIPKFRVFKNEEKRILGVLGAALHATADSLTI